MERNRKSSSMREKIAGAANSVKSAPRKVPMRAALRKRTDDLDQHTWSENRAVCRGSALIEHYRDPADQRFNVNDLTALRRPRRSRLLVLEDSPDSSEAFIICSDEKGALRVDGSQSFDFQPSYFKNFLCSGRKGYGSSQIVF
jgi:hypothetical protein